MFNNCWVEGGGECLGYARYGEILMTMTSYTKRCTSTRRVYWRKFGWNPTRSFCLICILVSLSLVPRQGLSLDFACLSIYGLTISPELFVCLSIYENAETLSRSGRYSENFPSQEDNPWNHWRGAPQFSQRVLVWRQCSHPPYGVFFINNVGTWLVERARKSRGRSTRGDVRSLDCVKIPNRVHRLYSGEGYQTGGRLPNGLQTEDKRRTLSKTLRAVCSAFIWINDICRQTHTYSIASPQHNLAPQRSPYSTI